MTKSLTSLQAFALNVEAITKQLAEPACIKPISTIDTTAAPKSEEHYDWFKFTGAKPLTLTSQGGSKLVLNKGSLFGTRASSNKKFIRLIGLETGINKVFTLAFDDVAALIKNCKPAARRDLL